MSEPTVPSPWLSIIGLGEDGLSGLSDASRGALNAAEVVFGGPRHLELAGVGARGMAWPVPFSIDPVLACAGRPVAVLASGDPFWFGAGSRLVAQLDPRAWQAFPGLSVFALAAAQLGWRLEECLCLGLHAAPFEHLTPVFGRGVRALCTVRDGAAVSELARWLTEQGFGATGVTVLEALGGPRQRRRTALAETLAFGDIQAPVCVALEGAGGVGLARTAGLPDALFASDGQMTKRPVRALTLSALAPRPGEVLWDIGGGSGSISVEWCLAAPRAQAHCIEPKPQRCSNIRANAARFGLAHRLAVHSGTAQACMPNLPAPDVVFVGGGYSADLISALWAGLPAGTRLVVNAVTLETEAALVAEHADKGGTLMRFELAEAKPLGALRGWVRSRPIVQWAVTR